MTARSIATALTRPGILALTVAMLVICSSGCATMSPTQEPATATPTASSTASIKEIDAGTAQRLDAAIEQARKASNVPGVIVGLWGPTAPTSGPSG